jgi:hypothetical protein
MITKFCKILSLIRLDHPITDYSVGGLVTETVTRPGALQRSLACLQECLGHATCNQVVKDLKDVTPPTRLLYLEQDSTLRLYTVAHRQSLPYAALSYCWGKTPQQRRARTLTTNVKARHSKFDLYLLPKTIRDAVKVTRALGISFLWVDALCIIQDDSRDMEIELARMGSIYQGATVTISAASSVSSKDGFLGWTSLTPLYGKVFHLPHRHSNDHEILGSVILCERTWGRDPQEPIDSRAWTMQENLLSVRLLRFGTLETTWRCQSAHKTVEGRPCPVPHRSSLEYMAGPYRHDKNQTKEVISEIEESHDWWQAWQLSIDVYTRRELSNSRDRLRACAALAERFAALRGLKSTDYYAGLWKNDIPAQLLWKRRADSWHETRDVTWKKLPAPSWSWASVDGPLLYWERYLLVADVDSPFPARAKLDESKMTPKLQGHSFSEPEPACLWLNGAIQQVYYDGSQAKQSIDYVNPLPLDLFWDSPTDPCQQTIWCFEVVVSTHAPEEPCTVGLILTRANEKEFERVGWFCSLDTSTVTWFEGAERQTICLI